VICSARNGVWRSARATLAWSVRPHPANIAFDVLARLEVPDVCLTELSTVLPVALMDGLSAPLIGPVVVANLHAAYVALPMD
jgi:hypothetical protein